MNTFQIWIVVVVMVTAPAFTIKTLQHIEGETYEETNTNQLTPVLDTEPGCNGSTRRETMDRYPSGI